MLLFRFDVFQPDPAPCMQAVARLFDSAQKSRIVWKTIFEPVFFRFKTDQDPSRLALTRDNDLLRLGLAQISGQVVFDSESGTSFTSTLRIVEAMRRSPSGYDRQISVSRKRVS